MKRQVPQKTKASYFLIGEGRVAKHFSYYFDLLGLSFRSWSRKKNSPDELDLSNVSHVLLLISDDALEPFFRQHKHLFKQKKVVHFSGCRSFDSIKSAHPLMSFGENLYDFDTYKNIPFVLEEGECLKEVLPGLENPSYFLSKEKKALYHSYCVMAGNFTSLLWSFVEEGFVKNLKLEKDILKMYKKKVFENIEKNTSLSLTGPFLREDKETISHHLKALKTDDLFCIYKAFLDVYKLKEERKKEKVFCVSNKEVQKKHSQNKSPFKERRSFL